MGVFNYGQFKGASRGKTPQFAAAAAKQAQLKQNAKARVNALRSQNIRGAAQLYNEGMGDRSPIADTLAGFGADPEVAAVESGGAEGALGSEEAGFDAATGELAAQDLSVEAATAQVEQQAAEAAAAELAATEAAAAEAAATEGVGGAVASSGGTPWGLIIAAANANEKGAYKAGRRDDSDTAYRNDLLSGAAVQQDARALGDKVGGVGGQAISKVGALGNPEGAWETSIKDPLTKILRDPLDPLALFS